jgi:glyoxylase-like metal-dependent hydrolase (beta-lactamase superfamily II)
MIAEIRKRTNKPVSCIINTHWHYDHTMGNQTYLDAFPGAEIISTTATRDLAISNGPPEKFIPAYQEEIVNVDKKLASEKDSDGQPLTAEHRKHMELAKADFEFWIRDAKTAKGALPSTTVTESLVLHRGERTIEIRFLGEGHTPGDLVVYLPKERIVATGDLVVHPVPFGGATNLKEWPKTLQALKKLDAATIVPGHGQIQYDWSYVDREIALTQSPWEQVQKAVNAGANLDAVRKAVNGDELSKAFGTTSPKDRDEFDYTYLDSAIEAAFKELHPDIATNK